MKYIYILKQVFIFIIIIVIIGMIIVSVKSKPKVIVEEQKPDTLCYTDSMEQIDCNIVEEKLFTEKYIRENIATLATDQEVLGGTWYVVSITIDPTTHTGEITYEDGHIQSNARITYSYQKNPQSVAVTKWEVKK